MVSSETTQTTTNFCLRDEVKAYYALSANQGGLGKSPTVNTTTTTTSAAASTPIVFSEQQQQSQQPQNSQRHYSTSSDARSVYSSNTSVTRKSIIFVTPAKYTTFVLCLLAIPIVTIVACMILLDPTQINYRSSSTTWILGWALLFVLVVYMAILPKQVDVRSTGTVGIKTFLLTFHIDGIVRAYQAGLGREDFLRPRIRFGTSIQDRVVLRRNHGKWDVVVSPHDVEGFLKAVEEMVKEHGDNDTEGDDDDAGSPSANGNDASADELDNNNNHNNNIIIVPTILQHGTIPNGHGKGIPDLASTDYSTPHMIV
ncbi:hypothetical protein IV203_009890 [Nitzschia inconspicua]|uniref:Uncharacterized protein n=1 Tax=Nitzschia inconspicua TaxID=303405 RepID=A0A9K3PKC8_9STRA|nr:hypothetical protein IV203_009890 [Nitzschia inconspicua]